MVDVSVPCGSCGKPIRGGDAFCETCGAPVSEELKEALRSRLEASHTGFAEHTKKVRSARSTIGLLSVLFTLGGVVFFFITKAQAEQALNKLGHARDSDLLAQQIAGMNTVGELRAELAREPWQVLGLNLFLALVMLGLWIWSKRALVPAIITALGIYVTVMVASAIADPKTLAQGLLMKIVVTIALAKGVQAALAARKLELRQ
jgi:hypothetical protein